MNSILMSIQPKWCELIASGKKTIEVRKTAPKAPFRAFIYQTKKKWIYRLLEWLGLYQQKIIGEFVCDKVEMLDMYDYGKFDDMLDTQTAKFIHDSCLTLKEIRDYAKCKTVYGYHITSLKVYDKPRELGEFYGYNKELEQRFLDGEDYCCHDATNEYGEAMTECDGENIHNCYRCWEEWSGWCHRITRPPQSWQYVQEEAQNER